MRHLKNFRIFEAQTLSEARKGITHGFTGPLTEFQIQFLDNNMDKSVGGSWEYNPKTERVDVQGAFKCQKMKLTDFHGISFGDVSSDFRCGSNLLTSEALIHFPRTIGRDFQCYRNKLTTLVNGPVSVGGYYNVNHNKLETLEGLAPNIIGLDCEGNRLKDLSFTPRSMGTLRATHNKIDSFNGAPEKANLLDLSHNSFTDFDGLGVKDYEMLFLFKNNIQSFNGMNSDSLLTVQRLGLAGNQIRTLEGIGNMPDCDLDLKSNPLESFKGIGRLNRVSFGGTNETWRDNLWLSLDPESIIQGMKEVENPEYSDLTRLRFKDLLANQALLIPEILKELRKGVNHSMRAMIRRRYPELWQEMVKDTGEDIANTSADLGELGF